MGQRTTADGGTANTTSPEDVREDFQTLIEHQADDGRDTPPLLALVTPRSRARLLHVLLEATEPLTASELCERAQIDRSIFDDHMSALIAAGVANNPGKKGNAETYVPDRSHPVTQLLVMTETVQRHGVTPDLLDDQFVGEPGAGVDPETGEEL